MALALYTLFTPFVGSLKLSWASGAAQVVTLKKRPRFPLQIRRFLLKETMANCCGRRQRKILWLPLWLWPEGPEPVARKEIQPLAINCVRTLNCLPLDNRFILISCALFQHLFPHLSQLKSEGSSGRSRMCHLLLSGQVFENNP